MCAGRKIVAAVSVGLMSLTPALAAKSDVQITGIYSDLYYNAEGGDLLGTEIFIVFADTDDFVAFVQCWQGGTTRPTVVSVGVNEDAISFAVPEPASCAGTFKGRITISGFDGVWTHSVGQGRTETEPVHLKRKHSYWQ
jgi:hypothetical protein